MKKQPLYALVTTNNIEKPIEYVGHLKECLERGAEWIEDIPDFAVGPPSEDDIKEYIRLFNEEHSFTYEGERGESASVVIQRLLVAGIPILR